MVSLSNHEARLLLFLRVILTTKFVRIQKSNLDSDACYAVSERRE